MRGENDHDEKPDQRTAIHRNANKVASTEKGKAPCSLVSERFVVNTSFSRMFVTCLTPNFFFLCHPGLRLHDNPSLKEGKIHAFLWVLRRSECQFADAYVCYSIRPEERDNFSMHFSR